VSNRNDLRNRILDALLNQQAKDFGTVRRPDEITTAEHQTWGPYADAVVRLFAVVDRESSDVDTSTYADVKQQILRQHWLVAKVAHHTERLEVERWAP
jgi:hypothetical protein